MPDHRVAGLSRAVLHNPRTKYRSNRNENENETKTKRKRNKTKTKRKRNETKTRICAAVWWLKFWRKSAPPCAGRNLDKNLRRRVLAEILANRSTQKKRKMPILKELSRTSQDSFESESDSQESRDVRLNSPRSCIFHFSRFWANQTHRPGMNPVRKNLGMIDSIPSKMVLWNFGTFKNH